MEKQNKGGRAAEFTAIYFSLPSKRNPAWFLITEKFGHLGTAVLLANCEYMSASKHLQCHLDVQFYGSLLRDHKIDKEQFSSVVNFCIDELNLYDRFLFERKILFSLELLRNFHFAGYFRSRKYKATNILAAINFIRSDQAPLTLEDEFEQLMASIGDNPDSSSFYEDSFDHDPDSRDVIRKIKADNELPF